MDADLTEYKPRWCDKFVHISDNCFVTGGGGGMSVGQNKKKKRIYTLSILFFSGLTHVL